MKQQADSKASDKTQVNTWMPLDLYNQFVSLCDEQWIKPTEAIRRLIAEFVKAKAQKK